MTVFNTVWRGDFPDLPTSAIVEHTGGPNLSYLFDTGSGVLPAGLAFSRASTGAYWDATGTLQSAAGNTPRFDYGASPGATPLGLLIEESRTNGIRNNTAAGGVAGTPGTLPTNWTVNGLGTLSYSVVGTGTESGLSYCDLRVYGTTSTTSCYIEPEAVGIVAATQGQVWTLSSYVRIVSGSTSNITSFSLDIGETASGSYKTQGNKAFTPTTAALSFAARGEYLYHRERNDGSYIPVSADWLFERRGDRHHAARRLATARTGRLRDLADPDERLGGHASGRSVFDELRL